MYRQVRQGIAKSKRMPALLTTRAKEAIQSKESLLCKSGRSALINRTERDHRIWQKKCQLIMRRAKGEFGKPIAKCIRTKNKYFFEYVQRRKWTLRSNNCGLTKGRVCSLEAGRCSHGQPTDPLVCWLRGGGGEAMGAFQTPDPVCPHGSVLPKT